MQLRKADLNSIAASRGKAATATILEAIAISKHSHVIVHRGSVEGVFGIAEVNGLGVPWLLATDKLPHFHWRFLKQSRHVVDVWARHFPCLTNYVDSRNTAALRWLRWLGFTVHIDSPIQLHDPAVDFYQFTLHRGEQG